MAIEVQVWDGDGMDPDLAPQPGVDERATQARKRLRSEKAVGQLYGFIAMSAITILGFVEVMMSVAFTPWYTSCALAALNLAIMVWVGRSIERVLRMPVEIQVFEGDGVQPRDCRELTYDELSALDKLRAFPHLRKHVGGLATWLRRLARGNRRNVTNIASAETVIMSELCGTMYLRPATPSPVPLKVLYSSLRAIRRVRSINAH